MSQHRQFMNAKITEINNNYYETWGINNQTSNLNSNIQSLEHEATQLGIRINEIRKEQAIAYKTNQEKQRKLFFYFKTIITELETTIEILKLIAQEKPELDSLIKESIVKNNADINNKDKFKSYLTEIMQNSIRGE
ncbi:TPA: hypothetical protein NV714_002672 [Escherichia coli]|nr:hypothetical protein [Escherichia coli]